MHSYRIIDEQGNEVTPQSNLDYLGIDRLCKKAKLLRAQAKEQLAARQPIGSRLRRHAYSKSFTENRSNLLAGIRQTAEQDPTQLTKIIMNALLRLHKAEDCTYDITPIREADGVIYPIFAALNQDYEKYRENLRAIVKVIIEYPCSDDIRSNYNHTLALATRWAEQLGLPVKKRADLEILAESFGYAADYGGGLIEALPTVYTAEERTSIIEHILENAGTHYIEKEAHKWARTLAEQAIREGGKKYKAKQAGKTKEIA